MQDKDLLPGEICELSIEGINHQGEGVARLDGRAVFVSYALPGERVKACITFSKKRLAYAAAADVLSPSPYRAAPRCPFFGSCGGCDLQHAAYSYQLELKHQIVCDVLRRIGGFENPPVLPVLGMENPWHYRNKAELHVEVFAEKKGGKGERGKEERCDGELGREEQHNQKEQKSEEKRQGEKAPALLALGYCRAGSREVIDFESCDLIPAEWHAVICDLREGLSELAVLAHRAGRRFPVKHLLLRQSFFSGEVAVVWVIESASDPCWREWVGRYAPRFMQRFPQIACLAENVNPEGEAARGGGILGKETRVIRGKGFIRERFGELEFRVSPVSFFQVNPLQAAVLYEQVKRYAQLTGSERVIDVYCGVGTITLFLARQAKEAVGIEAVPEAVEDARENARLNRISNAVFYSGNAAEILSWLARGPRSARSRGGRECSLRLGKPGIAASGRQDPSLRTPLVVVLNPPRGGCEKGVLRAVGELAPQRIVYVSCNPVTLARDLRVLADSGYELAEIQPVDMFPQTAHVECVVSLKACAGPATA